MKICPRLIISDCTLRIFRGYDFRICKILLFLDRYFGVFDLDFRVSPPLCLVMECPLGAIMQKRRAISFPRGEGAHKHFFDRNARPRTNFNYPKKNDSKFKPKKIECPKIQNQKNRMTQDAMLVKV